MKHIYLIPLLCLAIIPAMAQTKLAPSLNKSPQLTDAPGRGIQANVSNHSAATPELYELDAQPVEQISPLVQRQMLNGAQSTLVKWTVKTGGLFRVKVDTGPVLLK